MSFKQTMLVTVLLSNLFMSHAYAEDYISGLKNVRFVKEVLKGVLYRGGGKGGMTELTSPALDSLCDNGFSEAVYLYNTDFSGPQTVKCGGNTLDYEYHSFRGKGRVAILNEIYDVIKSSHAGPVFVHCWNGQHATGEISAVALRQFCGYSGEEAKSYWKKTLANSKDANAYPEVLKSIDKFKPIDDLKLTDSEQKAICP
jgi:hypothetical protein